MTRFLAPLLRRLWRPADRLPDAFDSVGHEIDAAISANAATAVREQERHETMVRQAIADCFERMGVQDTGGSEMNAQDTGVRDAANGG